LKREKKIGLDFEVDKITNSIENLATGEVFDTEIVRLDDAGIKQIKKSDWQFNWHKEFRDKTKEVYKLTTLNNPTIIQGLVSIEDKNDHIFMHLIESSKFNKGKSKVYLGVPANLVAFACKVSVDKGYEGFLAFDAKSALIKHYEQSLHATHFRGLRMFIETSAALKLISQYFKN
jgi:glutaredoxin-related protein